MSNENNNDNSEVENEVLGFSLNEQGVVLVLSLIQYALKKGDVFGIDDLPVISQFTLECKDYLNRMEEQKNNSNNEL